MIEIVEEIFGKYPEAAFDKRLQKSYQPREYCVQYDESDLDFVQRLLEHEGIFYFFEYGESGHTLVLADTIAKLKPAPGYATVPFHFEDDPARRDRDFLSDWLVTSSLRPAAYAHTDYNFEKPSLSLLTQSEAEPVAKLFKGESYRQPGAHLELGARRRRGGDPARGAAGAARAGAGRGHGAGARLGLPVHAGELSAREPERRAPGAARRLPRGRSRVPRRRSRARARATASSSWWRRPPCPTGRRGRRRGR